MKKLIGILVLLTITAGSLLAQTVSFNFSLHPVSVSGWTNVVGDPSVTTLTASASGISISSVSPANWSPYSGESSFDTIGVSNGTFFPAGVMLNNWYQYGTLGNYNAAVPQFVISGLNPDSVYTIKMTSSNATGGFDSDPVRYTVIGAVIVGYQDINTTNNTSAGATFINVTPTSGGTVSVYVNTVSGVSDMANISGIQIITARTAAPTPVVRITSPNNGDILAEDGNITINATASESGGSISKVAFYNDTTKLGESTTAPYSYTWVSPNAGQYTIKAQAFDASGNSSIYSIMISVEPLSGFWSNTGNIALNGDSNFLGTVDTNRLTFRTNNIERMTILKDGTVGIGTKTTYGYSLAVNGTAIFTKAKVKTAGTWPDYVFDRTYALPDLNQLEAYLKANKHLPGIEPAAKVEKDGIDIAEGQAALLKKVEELTLYIIQQNKTLEAQQKEIDELKALLKDKK